MDDFEKLRAVLGVGTEPQKRRHLILVKAIMLLASALLLVRAGFVIHDHMPALVRLPR